MRIVLIWFELTAGVAEAMKCTGDEALIAAAGATTVRDALRELRFQVALHLWPLFGDDAEDDRVAVTSAPHQHVIAQDAFLLGADARDGGARLQIRLVGLQHHAAGIHRFEGVPQHQILGFGVDGGALVRARDPRPADLHGAVLSLYVGEARATHDGVRLLIARGESDHRSRSAQLQCFFYIGAHLVAVADVDGGELPQLGIESDCTERVEMLERERLQPDVISFESDGFDAHELKNYHSRHRDTEEPWLITSSA
jgi:hypothetical protein